MTYLSKGWDEMTNFFTVFMFHFKENVTSKSFILSCCFLFFIVFGFIGFQHFSNNDEEKSKILIINETTSASLDIKTFNETHPKLELIGGKNETNAKEQVMNGEVDGLYVLKEEKDHTTIQYFYNGFPNQNATLIMENSVYQAGLEQLILTGKVAPEAVHLVLNKPVTSYHSLQEKSENIGIVYVFIFLLYFFIVMFGQVVANSIVTEKTTRVMEMMIPKVKPITMMYAKIAAVLTTGILQISVMVVSFFATKIVGWLDKNELNVFGMGIDISNITLGIVCMFVVYFVLGFMLYALLYASLGSMVNRSEDLQSLMTPVITLLMGALLLGTKAMFDPKSSLVEVTSYVPFFSPIVSFARLVLGEAGRVEIGLSVGILISTIVFFGFFAGKVYKNGVMRYQSKVSLKDVLTIIKNKS